MAKLFHEWKSNHKIVNFGNWFLYQFSPKTYNFLHGAFLTPQIFWNNLACKKKQKTWRGCFSQLKLVPIYLFFKIYEKHPLKAKIAFKVWKIWILLIFIAFTRRVWGKNHLNWKWKGYFLPKLAKSWKFWMLHPPLKLCHSALMYVDARSCCNWNSFNFFYLRYILILVRVTVHGWSKNISSLKYCCQADDDQMIQIIQIIQRRKISPRGFVWLSDSAEINTIYRYPSVLN